VRVVGIVLAAGSSSRFGAPKLLARLDGRPVLEHVLEALRGAGLDEVVVVLGAAGEALEAGIAWQDERRVRNPTPEAGLSSSVRVGLAAVPDGADAALIALGDQPRIRTATIARVIETAAAGDRPVVRARHAGNTSPNPVLVRRSAFRLADEAVGDRGLGPVLARHPELVVDVPVEGDNPDVDTPADLAAVGSTSRRPVIRRATSADAAELTRLRRALSEEDGPVPEDAGFATRFAAFCEAALGGDDWTVWVAEADGRLVADAWVQLIERVPRPADPTGPIAYITNVFVEPQLRNHGLGKAILDVAIAGVRDAGAALAILWPRQRSLPFYERAGFVLEDEPLTLRFRGG
jgi:molybdenum cofactor cytidylyltransferase